VNVRLGAQQSCGIKTTMRLPNIELNAIPQTFSLTDKLALRPLGIGTIVLSKKLAGAVPCTMTAENKHAVRTIQLLPALITWSDDHSELLSFLRVFKLDTAFLTASSLMTQSLLKDESARNASTVSSVERMLSVVHCESKKGPLYFCP
jgi:hypothetical protein